MALADDFRALLQELPKDWEEASILVRFTDEAAARRAAALLLSLNPGHYDGVVRFVVSRRATPELVLRGLRRVDAAQLGGELALVSSTLSTPVPEAPRASLAAAWDVEVAALPPDWSDVYAELELRSTDNLEQGALLAAPINPARVDERPAFRFRCARKFGYGAAPGMVRRCLERLDGADIRGEVHILRALSDTKPWSTQGPVWYVDGRPV
ncbi:MAG: hypothetical protein ABI717_00700 [Actinomycetota bacterium]